MAGDLILDDAAEELFRELGGAGGSGSGSRYDMTGLTETLYDLDKRQDPWRTLLISFVQNVARYIWTWQTGKLREADHAMNDLAAILTKLGKKSNHGGRVLIRHQGRGVSEEGRASARYDYVVIFSGIEMDVLQVRTASRRMGVTASDFPQIFIRALETLADCGVTNLYFQVGESGPEHRERLKRCLMALGAYFKVIAAEKALKNSGATRQKEAPLIFDENGFPDPNLASLAVINKQKKSAVAGLVTKIHEMLEKPDAGAALSECTSVYEAFFAFKKLRANLHRPPVEVNNVKWFLVSHPDEMVLPEEARTARRAVKVFENQAVPIARCLDTLYSPGFRFQNQRQLVERLGLCSRILDFLDEQASEESRDQAEHIREMVEMRLEMVPDGLFMEIRLDGNRLLLDMADKENGGKHSEKIHPRLLDLLVFFRQRAQTRRKVKSILQQNIDFTDKDYTTLARDFGIDDAEARDIVGRLKGCFDQEGHFLRANFEKQITDFCCHEDKIFDFLWHFLKEHMHKNERISFLNALKSLIDKMSGHHAALYVLLNDFAHDPEKVTFSDRNALMLCNALLRKFNKELHQDIEMTPEEVLLVVEGIDVDSTDFAREFIDGDKDRFFLKFRHIHRRIREGLDHRGRDDSMPMRYLLTLEREMYMLFALLGGQTGNAVLRSGLREYGDPESGIYEFVASHMHMDWLLAILQVISRALGRMGDRSDANTLREILPRMPYFMNLSSEARHKDQVRRLMRWVEKSAEKIEDRTKAAPPLSAGSKPVKG